MNYFKCENKCCTINISNYVKVYSKQNKNYSKAGVFIYDPVKNNVLLVQSRGRLWGPPKGSKNINETNKECAIREVLEETGINISEDDLTKYVILHNKIIYYYLEMDTRDVSIQTHVPGNDVNALGWINCKCLEKLILDNYITLTQHSRVLFKKFLNKKYPHSNFTLVKKK
jgi:ADP-ribose pyrophosphatase YjhB (NUDIX family)